MKNGILYFLNSPVFGDLICCLNIQGRWLTQTGRCRINEACTLSSYHLSCLKLREVPKKWQCPLCHKNSLTQKPKRLEELWWRSGESTRLPPMWLGFDFQTRRHILVEFVGSLLCSERFFPGYSGFPISSKSAFD